MSYDRNRFCEAPPFVIADVADQPMSVTLGTPTKPGGVLLIQRKPESAAVTVEGIVVPAGGSVSFVAVERRARPGGEPLVVWERDAPAEAKGRGESL